MAQGQHHDNQFNPAFDLLVIVFAQILAFGMISKSTSDKLRRPSWTRSPFAWRQDPLQGLCFINCWAGAGTLGMGIGLLTINRERFGHFCDWLSFTLGLLLAQILIYRRFHQRIEDISKNDRNPTESTNQVGVRLVTFMGTAAFIFIAFGLLDLQSLPLLFGQEQNSHWPFVLAKAVLGLCLIVVGIGIWKRLLFAWYVGFMAIVLVCAHFIVQVWYFVPHVSDTETTVIRLSCFISAVLICAYWTAVWLRQRNWFLNKTN